MASASRPAPPVELVELVEFLADPKADVRKEAAGLVEGLSGSDAGLDTLAAVTETLVPALLGMLWGHGAEAKAAAAALANLSHRPAVVAAVLQGSGLAKVLPGVVHPGCGHKAVLLALLANVSAQGGDKAATELAAHLPALATVLEQAGPSGSEAAGHACSVLCNSMQAAAGRSALLAAAGQHRLLRALVGQMASTSAVCRLWALMTVRNLCMDAEAVAALVAPDAAAAAVLPALLRPLSGAEPREPEATVRHAAAEAVLLVAASEAGRAALWAANAPVLLGKGYEDEEDPATCAALENAARIFIAQGRIDESGGEEGSEGAGPAPEPDAPPPAPAASAPPAADPELAKLMAARQRRQEQGLGQSGAFGAAGAKPVGQYQ